MYDELVTRLRELHPEEFGNAWDFAFACQQAMHEAADAIEELSTELECLKSYEHDARTMGYKTDKEREASDKWEKLMARFGYTEGET